MGLFSFLTGSSTLDATVKSMCATVNSALEGGNSIQEALIRMYKNDAIKCRSLRPIPAEKYFLGVYENDFLALTIDSPDAREFIVNAIVTIVEAYFFPGTSKMDKLRESGYQFDVTVMLEKSECEVLTDRYLMKF